MEKFNEGDLITCIKECRFKGVHEKRWKVAITKGKLYKVTGFRDDDDEKLVGVIDNFGGEHFFSFSNFKGPRYTKLKKLYGNQK